MYWRSLVDKDLCARTEESMNWWAFFGFILLAYFSGPGDPSSLYDFCIAVIVCVLIGTLIGRALA